MQCIANIFILSIVFNLHLQVQQFSLPLPFETALSKGINTVDIFRLKFTVLSLPKVFLSVFGVRAYKDVGQN